MDELAHDLLGAVAHELGEARDHDRPPSKLILQVMLLYSSGPGFQPILDEC
ncbi:MAG: hypothetical protein H0V60_02880 [Actinobacteria bacterium]|nr:hypothetical protein [Actinomycetota bacterium]